MSINLFSPEGDGIFNDGRRISTVLPKFVAIGSDTKAHGFVVSALKEIVHISQFTYLLASGHRVIISACPVILGGDRLVLPLLTGGAAPTHQAAAIFDVKFDILGFNIIRTTIILKYVYNKWYNIMI